MGRYVAIANIHPDSESECQQNMIGTVGVTVTKPVLPTTMTSWISSLGGGGGWATAS